ncbi:acyl-CoA sterol acyl transferase 1, ARABIDOPSIS THALIANA STEROL O-ACYLTRANSFERASE 1 [Hibiscus trionum]|uniref:Acyl-CoA sterol acyl transferase 1, ARABIDOPSIS THALIANA STEROL O-ACYLTRANSFERASE 1 n=1 Tax=Hibiscus trionum TaxID=183268 RepID=A0A9W7H817_HIBTR|nr:acyl-CoA sterol acyl transferase 1, ARABIDOPSIS THALIANA STEROL O-ACYLTRANSFERASE 1 [Hibiscus trionum]
MFEQEINNFTKLWLCIIISLCYCYSIGKTKIIPKGTARLLCFLPVICLFLSVPLNLSSLHLGGTTAFFIAWLANFKLLLFALGKGPLSPPSLSLPRFLSIACLPIKIQQNPTLNSLNGQQTITNNAIKILLFVLLLRIYDYSDRIHPTIMLVLYSFHVYVVLEMVLALVASMARALLGLELEKQFDEPYLSTSLQDFWGRRWNIMVTNILRPTVYEPVRDKASRFIGRKWAPIPAVFGTFVVSGVMHELMFYYLGRVWLTWEIMWFFLLHGACLTVEIAVKKAAVGVKWRLPRAVSTPLTVGFVMFTAFWLFFPPLLRCRADERSLEEYAALGAFIKKVTALTLRSFQF